MIRPRFFGLGEATGRAATTEGGPVGERIEAVPRAMFEGTVSDVPQELFGIGAVLFTT